MTLPASQQRALDAIDDVLESADPRLAAMFGVFTDLTRPAAMPAVETLPPGRWQLRHWLPGPRYQPGWVVQPRYRPGGGNGAPGGAGRPVAGVWPATGGR